ncbi:hypothetical protein [Microscilla marina]|uniref:Uncharacterized protein n=1 Tax=Microscilla marina ATCC 23134 TaxID=313606 RepID=A1ZVK6_MICM2|nr:hypothetical protein [Microscilla marina]EAY25549.1 hypothetical protein M23134_00647 [Microscilla marina ATCC 23134]
MTAKDEDKTDHEQINKIRSLIYTQQPANIELAFQLMVNVVAMPPDQALRILFVELLTLREHTGCSGKLDDPFVDFMIYGVQVRYFWDRNGIYYYTQGKKHCLLEMDRYHLLHVSNIRERCVQHFHQHLYQFGYLVAQQMKK